MATYRVKATKDELISWEDALGKHKATTRRTCTSSCITKETALELAEVLSMAGWTYVQVTTNRGADHLIRYQDGKVTYNAP